MTAPAAFFASVTGFMMSVDPGVTGAEGGAVVGATSCGSSSAGLGCAGAVACAGCAGGCWGPTGAAGCRARDCCAPAAICARSVSRSPRSAISDRLTPVRSLIRLTTPSKSAPVVLARMTIWRGVGMPLLQALRRAQVPQLFVDPLHLGIGLGHVGFGLGLPGLELGFELFLPAIGHALVRIDPDRKSVV